VASPWGSLAAAPRHRRRARSSLPSPPLFLRSRDQEAGGSEGRVAMGGVEESEDSRSGGVGRLLESEVAEM
jgi:hypothetical protein